MTPTKSESPRRALGKGLESLLPERQSSNQPPEPDGRPLNLAVDSIERNPFQTRTRFDESSLQELAASIAASGVIQPIIVRSLGSGRYQLITGERRLLASKQVGHATIPAILRSASDEQTMEMTIVENLQRADLNPMEQARAYQRLSQDFKMTQEQMALRTGKDRASVSNFLRLLRLPQAIQDKVEEGVLTFGHARSFLGLETAEQMLAASRKVISAGMSVRQTEAYVQSLLHPESHKKTSVARSEKQDANVRAAQERIQRSLGLKVAIEDHQGKGRVIIEYARLEDFDTLLATICGEQQSS